MIFTRRAYAQARIMHASFYKLLDALILTNTFLFIGCSVRDPDLQLLLENHAFTYPQNKPHYIAMPQVHLELMDLMRQNMNLKALTYSAKDDHKELLDSVGDLVNRVEDRRLTIALENDW
jgi:SIR2-like domain